MSVEIEVPADAPEPTESVTTEQSPAGVAADTAPASTPTADAPAVTTPEPAPQPGFRDILRDKYGWDVSSKYQSDEDAVKGLKEMTSFVGRKSEKERLAEQVAPYLNDFVAWRQQQLAAQQQPQYQPAPEAQPLFAEPQLQEGDQDWVEPDPENPGRSRIMRDAPGDVKKRLLDRVRFIKAVQENPAQIFAPTFDRMQQQIAEQAEQRAVYRVQQLLQAERQQAYEQQTIHEIKAQREALFWQKDAQGNLLVGFDGQRIPSDYARAYIERESQLFAAGLADHRLRDQIANEYAEAKLKGALGGSPKKPAPGATKAPHTTGGRTPTGKVKSGSLSDMLRTDNADVPDDVSELVIT